MFDLMLLYLRYLVYENLIVYLSGKHFGKGPFSKYDWVEMNVFFEHINITKEAQGFVIIYDNYKMDAFCQFSH